MVETQGFDAKRELPTGKSTAELAKDVAAMATDGGVLLYGVGEDEDKRLTDLRPFDLAGAAERVDQVVASSIREVPSIQVHTLPLAGDPARGYLLVVVPQSERAPHQVVVGGDLRYYGRGASGNRRLTEPDVARLYERRRRWEVDRETLLDAAIALAPVDSVSGPGHFHGFVRPVVSSPEILSKAAGSLDVEPRGLVQPLIQRLRQTLLSSRFEPSLTSAPYWERAGADAWRLSTVRESERQSGVRGATDFAEMEFAIDGHCRVFNGRVVDTSRSRVILELIVAGMAEQMTAASGWLLAQAGYTGSVDIGIALTGLRGARSLALENSILANAQPYGADDWRVAVRVSAADLLDPVGLSQRLVGRFYKATVGDETYDVFELNR